MGLRPSDHKSSSNIPILDAGAHTAICVQILDLGTHHDEKFGKNNRKVRLTWELPEETYTFKEEKGEEPRLISKTYNFSNHEKSTFIKDMVSWNGGELAEDFDIENLVGVPAMINVVHERKAPNKVYANVSAVMPVMKAMRGKMPKPHNPTFYWSIESGRDETFKNLPDFLKEMIVTCQEWNTETPDDAAATAITTASEEDPDWN